VSRPSTIPATFATLYDWLAANDVDEVLPEHPIIEVNAAAATIRYTAFQWDGPRGWNYAHLRVGRQDVGREWRTVPLTVPPSPDVVMAAMLGSAAIIGAE
jgi:hypothetical protein